MDAVAPLAGQLVQILAPFMPYLIKAGEGLGAQAAQHLEEQGRDLADKLWARLVPKVSSKPAAQEAADDLAAQPADEDARAALRIQLRKLLADDPDLQHTLEGILKAAAGQTQGTTNVTASGDRSVAIGRDVRGGTIITGDQNKN